jgi:hypothetical protein
MMASGYRVVHRFSNTISNTFLDQTNRRELTKYTNLAEDVHLTNALDMKITPHARM